ncbi:PTS 2-O-a-mannosyl-D-glycerate transporter subunit IIABC [Candidatus Epulonipiscium viviparus]|uniref:PTS 2-O-a-mannosyl-D-glycerate transporter subunit IIABC n=1 Tax=Candidatus Epulonipiscium viviparus TaxID=420336 RepID=UPI00016C0888|nr:PTS 2-O-a-mannosyl-D-glycerate transporter subunit IIABC [Candidatus Epulopiscium viviparus]
MELSRLTNESMIFLNMPYSTKSEVIDAMVKALFDNGKITSIEDFTAAIYDREAISETGIENGLAIPHGKADCVAEAAFVIMTTEGIVSDWESIDEDNEVQHIVMLAIPKSEGGSTHLDLLATLMERMSDEDYATKLFSSKTVSELYNNLDSENTQEEQHIEYTKSIVAVTACPAGIAHTYMAAQALEKAGKELGVKVYVEKQGANGIEGRLTTEQLQEADAAIFSVGVAVKNIERFNHLPITQTSVAEPLKDAKSIINRALKKAETHEKGSFDASTQSPQKLGLGEEIKQAVMTGISHMVPFVVAGGMILAFAVLISQQFNLVEEYNTAGHWLNSFRQLSGGLLGTLLVPVMAAYMAFAIGEKPALVSGFAAGFAANLVGGGFLAGMLGGLIAGYSVRYMKKIIPAKGPFSGFISFFIYPVVSVIWIGIIMFFVIGEPVAFINLKLTDFLRDLQGTNVIILGIVIGIMTSFDLGGPVNKAAYAFCVSVMQEGVLVPYAIFASVKMVSGFAITMTTLIEKESYTTEELEAGRTTWLLALGGITEGAIPFMMKHPLQVMTSLCTGSAVCGAIVAFANVGLNVPGAGIFSMFLLDYSTTGLSPTFGAAIWLGAAIVGAIVSTAILVPLMRRDRARGKA